jgi:hypothetical protein
MRRLTLLLFLMIVGAFRWIIGSAEAPIKTEEKDAGFKTHVTLVAVNTGCEATAVAASTDPGDTAWIAHELLSAAMDARPHANTAILFQRNRPVEFERVRLL